MKHTITLLLIGLHLLAFGQHHDSEKKNRIAAIMGYAFVPEQIEENGGNKSRLIPLFGIDYQRVVSEKFSIGLYNDIEASTYFIKDSQRNEESLQREYVFISTLCVVYKVVEPWSVYMGGGYEFETHQNFPVFRLGSEYEVPIRNNWDVAFGFSWDYKEVYNNISFTVGFGKRF